MNRSVVMGKIFALISFSIFSSCARIPDSNPNSKLALSDLTNQFLAQAISDYQNGLQILAKENPRKKNADIGDPHKDGKSVEFYVQEINKNVKGKPNQKQKIEAAWLAKKYGNIHGTIEGVKQGVEAAGKEAEVESGPKASEEFYKDRQKSIIEKAINTARADVKNRGAILDALPPADPNNGKEYSYNEAYMKGTVEGAAFGHLQGGRAAGLADAKNNIEVKLRDAAIQRVKASTIKRAQDELDQTDKLEFKTVDLPNDVVSMLFESIAWEKSPNFYPDAGFSNEELKKIYVDEYTKAFKSSAATSFEQAKSKAKPQLLNSMKYWKKQELAKKDQNEADRTAADLARQGYLQGYLEGKIFAYKEDFNAGVEEGLKPSAETKAKYDKEESDRIYKEEMLRLRSGSLIKFDAAVFQEVDDDSIFAPADSVMLNLVMLNLGMSPQSEKITVQLKGTDSDRFEFSSTQATLPQIAPRTKTMVRGALRFKIKDDTAADTDHAVTLQVLGDGKLIGEKTVSLKVKYPYAVTQSGFPSYVRSGQNNNVNVEITNLGTKAGRSSLRAELVSSDGKSQVTAGTADLGQVPGKGKVTAKFAFAPLNNDPYGDRAFEVKLYENNVVLGKFKTSTHASSTWSEQLGAVALLVANQTQTIQAFQMASQAYGEPIDIWNDRAEGAVTFDVLNKYKDRAVFIMDSYTMATATDSNISRFAVSGTWMFYDNIRNISLDFRRQRTVTLNAPFEKLAAVVHTNSLERAGHYYNYMERMDVASSNFVEQFQDAVVLGFSIEKKVSELVLATDPKGGAVNQARAALLSKAIVFELSAEMMDDKEIDGTSYSEDDPTRDKTLVTRFINKVMTYTDEQKAPFYALYDALDTAADNSKNGFFDRRGRRIRAILSPIDN